VQPGSYQGTWEVRTSEEIVLGRLLVNIQVAEGTPTPDVVVAITPQVTVASPTPATGQICVTAFDDRDGDGKHGADEKALAGAVFRLSDANGPKDVYTTDGTHEPYCFTRLQPGNYPLAMEPPSGYVETTLKSARIGLRGSDKADVFFGVRRSAADSTSTPAINASGNTPVMGSTTSGIIQTALMVTFIVIAVGLGLVLGFASSNRR